MDHPSTSPRYQTQNSQLKLNTLHSALITQIIVVCLNQTIVCYRHTKKLKMNTLTKILSSRARAEIFRILFGVVPYEYHLREIERQSDLSIGTVRQEAANLEKMGLIIKRKDSNRTYYKADRGHPLYPVIHQLVLKTSGLVDILKDALFDSAVDFVFVFGSIARGTDKAESDIDLFIISDLSLREITKNLKNISSLIGRELNPYVIKHEAFIKRKKENEHFVIRVMNSPKIFIIGTEDEFNRLGE